MKDFTGRRFLGLKGLEAHGRQSTSEHTPKCHPLCPWGSPRGRRSAGDCPAASSRGWAAVPRPGSPNTSCPVKHAVFVDRSYRPFVCRSRVDDEGRVRRSQVGRTHNREKSFSAEVSLRGQLSVDNGRNQIAVGQITLCLHLVNRCFVALPIQYSHLRPGVFASLILHNSASRRASPRCPTSPITRSFPAP
jgi:hypothetical protein